MATALYVDYQVSFRNPAHHVGLAAEWSAKTRAQKNAWRDAYLQVLDAQAKSEEQETVVGDTRAQFDIDWDNGALDIRTQADYNHFVTTVGVLQARYSDLATLYRALSTTWLSLQAVENQQNGVVDSIRNALAESATFLEQARRAANLADSFNATLGDPPVVPDAHGQRRMPARWLIPGNRARMRFQEKIVGDVDAEELGIDPMELNTGDESDSSGVNDSDRSDSSGSSESDEESESDEWEGLPDSEDNEDDSEGVDNEDGEEEVQTIAEDELSDEQEDLPDERWVPQFRFGVGGCSEAYVWLKVNQHGQVLDVSCKT